MTAEDRENGWWDVDAAEEWTCPECGATSPVEQWEYCEPYCEDCGNHDGRRCPECGEDFDHVWGSRQIAEANAQRSAEGAPKEKP